ncbi:tol-pal system protein YbgF [Radicibacter daui]|uniref:tol-pal system protein YbgF n=1 Tax=Radicibacter daui TaxID=3064829 RepID=UPI004046E9C6
MTASFRMRHLPALLAVLLASSAAGLVALPAMAQDVGTLSRRVDTLERDVRVLNQQVYRGAGASTDGTAPVVPSGSAASQEIRLQQMEGLNQQLTGEVEELRNQVQKLQQQLDTMKSDVEYRLSALEQGTAGGAAAAAGATADTASAAQPANPGGITPPPSGGGQPAPLAPTSLGSISETTASGDAARTASAAANDPAGLYNSAIEQLRSRDFANAEVSFKDFLAKYPNHDLAANAQYWLGESYYGRNDFRSAALTFGEGYQKYPTSPKAPDFMLKLGLSLAGLGQKDNACVTYAKLISDVKNAPPGTISRAKAEQQKLGCS